ncbi:hypothetical protein JOL79_16370 [Microbispora sp. RL4-1S]|uniref:Uncharacterized protein n=1 Tax=Microbispora oryzae TaxID=2806554 RepID=A0A940WH22_9ACTN|nr:hypothetical protein [Microbispora oryzae]MBP2705391.1 hypothetical protein [Microbispora oryzae]
MITIRRGVRALGALVLFTTVSAAGCTAGNTAGGTAGGTTGGAAGGKAGGSECSTVRRDALPTWARTGFSDDGSGIRHVLGDNGDILAVLFNYPPTASADPDDTNKILWVSRLPQEPMRPLTITGVLDGTTTSVTREIAGGPGPSSVNLPKAGCWRLTLRWSGHTDSMSLEFAPPGTAAE